MRFVLLIFTTSILFTGCVKEPVAMNLYTPGKGVEKITSVDTVITKEMIQSVKSRISNKKIYK